MSGVALMVLGTWIITQVTMGHAFQRLGVKL